MPGGNYDSSKTRVGPVFDALRSKGGSWVRKLLGLAAGGSSGTPDTASDLTFLDGYWSPRERGLQPPVALLSWLIRNLADPITSTSIDQNRRALLAGDPAAVATALRLLRTSGESGGWHVFEGPTYPDAVIETPDALIVIEGKRTELGPTTSTTWMPNRHQMWRHMDAAWEIRGRRAVYGLFIVEGHPREPLLTPPVWQEAVRATLDPSALVGSFPHRGEGERAAMARGFLGVTTWQKVCTCFGIDFAGLPNTTEGLIA